MNIIQSNKTSPLLKQYLSYLSVIKEYRTDILSFFHWVGTSRKMAITIDDFSFADIEFVISITWNDMYGFIAYCQNKLNSCAGTRARKIVSIRQFWKHLKKSHLIDNNIAEELETPKLPKRIPKYLSLEESVRLLIACKDSPRDHCILTLLLNCTLRISELASLNLSQVSTEIIHVVGKGNKERKIFLTPAAKRSITHWLGNKHPPYGFYQYSTKKP